MAVTEYQFLQSKVFMIMNEIMNYTYQCGLRTSNYPNYPALISVAAAAKLRPDTVQG